MSRLFDPGEKIKCKNNNLLFYGGYVSDVFMVLCGCQATSRDIRKLLLPAKKQPVVKTHRKTANWSAGICILSPLDRTKLAELSLANRPLALASCLLYIIERIPFSSHSPSPCRPLIGCGYRKPTLLLYLFFPSVLSDLLIKHISCLHTHKECCHTREIPVIRSSVESRVSLFSLRVMLWKRW